MQIKRPVNIHKAYHAHIYFERETFEFATQLCQTIAEQFSLKVGRMHKQPVGPHPKWSCQITFGAKHFDEFIPWLETQRKGLTVFVHALTGNDWDDHTRYAYWLGEPVELDTSIFT